MMNNEFRVEDSKNWYLNLRKQIPDLTTELKDKVFSPVAVMFRGLSELLLQYDDRVKFPQTFHFDVGRLWQLRAELQTLINIDICWSILDDFVGDRQTSASRDDLYPIFRSRISSLLEDNDGQCRRRARLPSIANVALELARLASVACGSDDAMSDNVVLPIERALHYHFTRESTQFRYIQGKLRKELVDMTFGFAKRYLPMSPLAICESQRTRQLHPQAPISHHYIELEAVAMRLAHIGVLHWRVWGPLLYVQEDAPFQETPMDLDITQKGR
jgi:hypothetical protein